MNFQKSSSGQPTEGSIWKGIDLLTLSHFCYSYLVRIGAWILISFYLTYTEEESAQTLP